ncbi:MAG: hypothetical protein QM778_14960 [Myxococcales bacterium]
MSAAIAQAHVASAQTGAVSGRPDLSPTAAAHTMLLPVMDAPREAPAKAAESQQTPEDPRGLPAIEDPELPGLERRADGSYRFQGTNFSAVIPRDGQVKFRNSFFGFSRRMAPLAPPPRDLDPTPSGARIPQTTPLLAAQFRIDFQGYLQSRLGDDPYLSERRWFLDRTRELRDSLSARSFILSLRAALLKVWSAAGENLAQRKRETFELWNQTGDDERGEAARKLVLTFVRERCPQRSSCEFRPAELKRLNDKRSHAEAFAPYAPVARNRATPAP